MDYSTEEIRQLKNKIDAALANGNLDAWKTQFLTNIRNRINKYGTKTKLSHKQSAKLQDIIGSGDYRSNVTPLPTNRTTKSKPNRYHQQSNSMIAKEGRRLSKKIARNIIIFALILVGFSVYAVVQQSTSFNSLTSKNITGNRFTVTDGDTIRFIGSAKGTRLVGFNTPETFNAKCDQELTLGNRATERLRELVATTSITFKETPCACAPGTEGSDACNFGRNCGILSSDGRNVGQILISEGLAVEFNCGSYDCPPLPRPWCD